jgi:hypothetical protein
MINKVTPLTPLLPQISVVAQNTSPQAFSSLQTGQLLQAVVTEYQNNGQAVLETTLGQMAVRTDASLVKGQVLQFEVLTTSPQLALELKQDPLQTQLRALSSFIGRAMNLAPLMQQVQENSNPTIQNNNQSLPSSVPSDNGSIIALLTGKPTALASPQLPTLTQPVILKAAIVEQSTNGKAVLDIGGTRFQIAGELTGKVGQDIFLRVEPDKSKLIFTPFPPGNSAAKTANSPTGPPLSLATSQNSDLSPLLKAVQQLLPQGIVQLVATQQSTVQSLTAMQAENLIGQDAGKDMQSNVQRIGMNMEALLAKNEIGAAKASLKAALLEITSSQQKNEELAVSAKNILSTLEMYQVAQLKLEGDFLLFPLPFSFLENGFLLVDNPPEDENNTESSEQNRQFSLHLTMTELGDMEVRYYESKEGARIRFLFDSEEKAAFAATFQDELKETLSEVQLLGISFASGAQSPSRALLARMEKDDRPIFEAIG